MCAIVDASVVGELWDDNSSEAGRGFRQWIEGPNGSLVLGGKLTQELDSLRVTRWIRELTLGGKLRRFDDQDIAQLTAKLEARTSTDPLHCKSDDHHIIALALISGARLLFSNDRDLQQDFKNPGLITQPRGTVYSTLETKAFNRRRRVLLRHQQCDL